MINAINSWAKSIIFAVIITSFIEIILPNNNNKKYIKIIIGVYILIVILYPIISKGSNKKIDINDFIKEDINENKIVLEEQKIKLDNNNYIEKEYKEKIKEDIGKNLEERGYILNDYNIDFNNEEMYGTINSLDIKISKKEQENINEEKNNKKDILDVKEIKIDTTNNKPNESKTKNENQISKEEIDLINNYLSSYYGIQKEKIYINEER